MSEEDRPCRLTAGELNVVQEVSPDKINDNKIV